MFYIKNDQGRYFAGRGCGTDVFKTHQSRACRYNTRKAALKDLYYYSLSYCEVIEEPA